MTTAAHSPWAELAVGHALHALDPLEEGQFSTHLLQCRTCQRDLAQHQALAAELAYASPLVAVPATLDQRIRSIPRDFPKDEPSSLASPRSRPRRALLLAAAAAVVLAVIGVGAAITIGDHGSTGAVATCRHESACHVVVLRGAGGVARAHALVRGQRVSLLVDDLPVNDQRTRTYVLWQLPSSGAAVAVTPFDVPAPTRIVAHGVLPAPYAASPRLAISLEPGRVAPAHPSTPLAVG